MKMDDVYEELDEAKSELKTLREQYRTRVELAESLKKAHIDQQSKAKEANSRLEKLADELNEKNDELSAATSTVKELKLSLEHRESIINNLISVQEKLRVDFGEKLSKCEEENKMLVFSLEESNAKNIDQNREISGVKEEIERVKRLLEVCQKKCLEIENNTSKERGGLEDVFVRLEEEKSKFENQLKWKTEQFDNLKAAHEKLLDEFKRTEKEWEDKLVFPLPSEDTDARSVQVSELQQEIEGLKSLLAVSQKRCSEIENNAFKECRGKEDVYLKLEEENQKFENQIKWKKEQFGHLQEAHEKLQNEFKTRENDWEKEKAQLLDGISSLEAKLESQIRTSRDLERRLEICNQALAHEESRRKLLEVQVSELRSNFDNVCDEYDCVKSNFETMNAKRDQEIASLRSSLSKKDILYKEMEYTFRMVEQEKREMLESLKELQEAGKVSSASKLQNKLKSLENVHNGCLASLQAKESEWHSRMEKLRSNFDNVCGEYECAKSNFETMNAQRDQEIASLRSSLSKKDIRYKEMEYTFRMVEQEKREILELLKELQEAGKVSSASKLQNKQKSLENAHNGCLASLQAKESEWHSRMEKLAEEVIFWKLASEQKDKSLNEMNVVLEARDSVILNLELLNQESSLLVLISQSEFSEVLKEVQEAQIHEAGKNSFVCKLQNKLESVEHAHKDCLANFQANETEWRSQMEKLAEEVLLWKSASEKLKVEVEARDLVILNLELLNQESCLMSLILKSEFSKVLAENRAYMDRKNKYLEEDQEKGVFLSERVQNLEEMQVSLQSEVDKLNEMLEESLTRRLNSEKQVWEIKYELEKVRGALERANEDMDAQFCEANETRFELQVWKSVIQQLEENLERNIQTRREVEASLLSQTEMEMNLKLEKQKLNLLLEEKEKIINDLQKQLEQSAANLALTIESEENWVKNEFEQLVEEKDQRIYDLQQLVANLEHEFESSTSSFSSRLFQMQEETKLIRHSWEKIKEADLIKEIEIQEKNMMIVELESDLSRSLQRMELQEKKMGCSEEKNEKLELEKEKLVNSMSLLSERLEKLSMEDMQLMQSLGNILDGKDEHDPVKENKNIFLSSPLLKKVAERSPLMELN